MIFIPFVVIITIISIVYIQKKQNNNKIEITDEFKTVERLLNNTNESVFLTGKAGTGKTIFIKYFIENTTLRFVLLAPTGIAAREINGKTIHSFFNFPQQIKPEWVKFSESKKALLESLDLIIIDEVSMVSSNLFDCINKSLQLHRNNNKPFGGVRFLLVGDLYQLPPVEGSYFFESESIKSITYEKFELTKIFRQNAKQRDFIELLNKIRVAELSEKDLNILNTRYHEKAFKNAPTLTTKRKAAEIKNKEGLEQIKNIEYLFKAEINGDCGNENDYPAPKELKLKKGAKIMMLKNDNDGRWVNGSLGVIVKLDSDLIVVKLDNGKKYSVNCEIWEYYDSIYNDGKIDKSKEPIGVYRQYPIRLAYALTIHKSQGLTFKQVNIDIGDGAFSKGQMYVALSRCKSLDGIRLLTKVKKDDFIKNSEIDKYFSNIESFNTNLIMDKDEIKKYIDKAINTKCFCEFYYLKEGNITLRKVKIKKIKDETKIMSTEPKTYHISNIKSIRLL